MMLGGNANIDLPKKLTTRERWQKAIRKVIILGRFRKTLMTEENLFGKGIYNDFPSSVNMFDKPTEKKSIKVLHV